MKMPASPSFRALSAIWESPGMKYLHLSTPLETQLLLPVPMQIVQSILILVFILLIPFFFNYAVSWITYHWFYWRRTGAQVPPELPAVLPFLSNPVWFLWDSAAYVKRATTYAGKLTCVRISLLASGLYLFQEPEAVAAVWKHPLLSSPIFVYTYGLRNLFGMEEKAIKTYTADNSGVYRKPYPESNVAPHNRVDHVTHDILLRGLTGAGLAPSFQRFQDIVAKRLAELPVQDEWIEMPDLWMFFKDHVSTAVIESLFGPSLLAINPTFMENMWKFDAVTPYLSKGLPRFLAPAAYRIRDRLLCQIQYWYQYARESFDPSKIYPDGDGDPFWGSSMMRERQKMLLNVDNQDDASLASADLGLMWTSITNVMPSLMMAALHIFKDADLLHRVRTSLQDTVSHTPHFAVSMEKLLRKDLLQSTYAETLRLYTQVYVTRCTHENIRLGNWRLPANEIVMTCSYVSHRNDTFWNTKNGAYPLDRFWADRFLTDANDSSSGPIRRDLPIPRGDIASQNAGTEPTFSTRGLEGAWFPYGGGYGACPGRLFAKRLILWTCALLVSEFDIQIQTKDFEMDWSGFGLGTQGPKDKIAFSIRRRRL